MKKTLFLSFSLVVLLIFFSSSKNCNTPTTNSLRNPPNSSTLDSLQGVWVNENDSNNVITINRRIWASVFIDDNVFTRDTSYCYFSDVVVQADTILFSQIDTAALSGKYLIDVSPMNNGLGFIGRGCWEILGITKLEGDTFLSMRPAPYGNAKQIQEYKKK
jgi:hypothetical protein